MAEDLSIASKNTKPDNISVIFKIVLFVLPPTLAEQFNPHGHKLYSISLIGGTLLQALVPPHKYRFWWILGFGIAAAMATPFIFRSLGD